MAAPRPRVRVRPTRRAALLAGGAVVLFVVGTNVAAGWLFVLASLLLGAVLVGTLAPARMLRGIEVERFAPPEVRVGEPVLVELVVRTSRPLAWARLTDPAVAEASLFVSGLHRGGEVRLRSVRRAARRGAQEAGPVVVSTTAPFGTARAFVEVPVPTRTVVLPRLVPLEPFPPVLVLGTRGQAESRRQRVGLAGDPAGVREYRWGDPVRRIHWPATAHRGELMVRELEEDRAARVAVVVDTWADVGPRPASGPADRGDATEGGTDELAAILAGETVLDVACAMAASLVRRAAVDGWEVVLAGGRGGQPVALDRPDEGRALRWLAEVTGDGRVPVERVLRSAAVAEADRVVALVPSWRVNGGRALGDALPPGAIAFVVDAASFEPGRGDEPVVDAAAIVAALDAAGTATAVIARGGDVAEAWRMASGGAQ